MRVPRIFASLNLEHLSGAPLQLSKSDSQHLLVSLRLKQGRGLIVTDLNSGEEYDAVLSQTSPLAAATITGSTGRRDEGSTVDALIFATCRGKQNELILEKATELGARRVWLVQTERCTARLDSIGDSKLARWERLVEAAAKQCRRLSIPEIRLFSSAMDCAAAAVETSATSTPYLLSPDPGVPLITKLQPPAGNVHLFIGPEGGLSPHEVRHLIEVGFTQVRIGAHVLKAETAAIAGLALAQVLWSR